MEWNGIEANVNVLTITSVVALTIFLFIKFSRHGSIWKRTNTQPPSASQIKILQPVTCKPIDALCQVMLTVRPTSQPVFRN